jgi:uncharacterized protein (DUF2147 family)
MRPLLAPALVLAAALAGPALGQSAAGLWRTQPGDTGAYLHVRIGPCGGAPDRLCGAIEEAVGATRADLPGRTIIRDMAPDGAGRWSGGTIWAPDDDKTYRSRMSLAGDALKVEGCVLVVCRGQTWTRLD